MKTESRHSPVNFAVFFVCLAMITALILPAIVRQRTVARAFGCQNNMKKLGLGFHNYHSAYKQLPMACGGTESENESDAVSNKRRLGPLVALTPFMDHQELWETIVNPYVHEASDTAFPPMGPAPWFDANIYRPWGSGPDVFRCPDRADIVAKPAEKKIIVYTLEPVEGAVGAGMTTNYVINYGDAVFDAGLTPERDNVEQMNAARASQRGMFMAGRVMKFRDILDGTSNTLMMSETRASVLHKPETGIAKNVVGLRENPSLCLAAAKDGQTEWWEIGRGSRWCDGALPITGFQTILPPNSPSCTSDFGMFDGVISASSDHVGGVHILMGDGAVVFISDTIDTGDTTMPSVSVDEIGASAPGSQSPYGLWGALGTRASKESIDGRAFQQMAQPARNPLGGFRLPAGKKQVDFSKWTDKTGQITLSARFVRIIDKKTIELEDSTGALHQVPLNTLSDKDIFRAVSLDLNAQ